MLKSAALHGLPRDVRQVERWVRRIPRVAGGSQGLNGAKGFAKLVSVARTVGSLNRPDADAGVLQRSVARFGRSLLRVREQADSTKIAELFTETTYDGDAY